MRKIESQADQWPSAEEVERKQQSNQEDAERKNRIRREHPEAVPGTPEYNKGERERVKEMRERFPQYNRRRYRPGNGH